MVTRVENATRRCRVRWRRRPSAGIRGGGKAEMVAKGAAATAGPCPAARRWRRDRQACLRTAHFQLTSPQVARADGPGQPSPPRPTPPSAGASRLCPPAGTHQPCRAGPIRVPPCQHPVQRGRAPDDHVAANPMWPPHPQVHGRPAAPTGRGARQIVRRAHRAGPRPRPLPCARARAGGRLPRRAAAAWRRRPTPWRRGVPGAGACPCAGRMPPPCRLRIGRRRGIVKSARDPAAAGE